MGGAKREKTTVLLVDDEPFFLRYLSDFFAGQEYQVVTASNGNKALENAGRLQPSLIVLDLEMSALNGIETCRMLKADEATREIPVAILIGMENMNLSQIAFEAGAEVTMLKSMSPDQLLDMVEMVMRTENVSEPLAVPAA
ncbi:MAG: PleD family two-component system response regulator [Candidatus Methylomirabilales bacterium]